MNVEPATRDFGGRIDHEREVRCLLKQWQVIAAERCIEEQKLGCWCEAGYGALRALESMAVETPSQGKGGTDGEFGRLQSKRRIDLVQLKARAAGFAKSGQDFAGAALSHMNRELALRVIRDGQSTKTPSEQIRDIPVGPGHPHTVCKGLPGKPCITILRATSKGDRCGPCHTAAEMKPCARCLRVARKLVDGICGRCAAAEKQRAPKRKRPPRAASIEVAKEEPAAVSTITIDGTAVAEWLKRGLQIRRALEAKVERLSRELLDAKKTLQQLPKE